MREDAFSTVIGLKVNTEDGSQSSISNGFKKKETGEAAFFITWDEGSTTQQTLDEIDPLLKAVNDTVMIDAKMNLFRGPALHSIHTPQPFRRKELSENPLNYA